MLAHIFGGCAGCAPDWWFIGGYALVLLAILWIASRLS